jgi:S-layer domain protein
LNGKELATTDKLDAKANQTDLTALQNTVNGKASQDALNTLTTTVNGKASQDDLNTLKTDFGNYKTTTDDKLEKLKTSTEKLGIGETYNGIKYFRANSTGADATAGGTDAVAIGPEAKAAGGNTVALGMHASSYGTDSVTVGHGAAALGTASSSVVLGHSAQVGTKTEDVKYDGAQKIMTGDGKSGIAIGDHAVSRGDESIAIGKDALTTNKDKAETLASKSIAIGSGARSIGSNSAIAFGNGALNHWGADSSIAMGQDAESKDANTISIGHAASAEKGGLAIGTTAKSSEAGVALGELASSTTNGIAIGKSASANQNKTISIGLNAGVGQDADVTGTKHSNINIGVDSGTNVVGQFNVALGEKAGQYVRGKASVAIGLEAGKNISSSSSPETLIENVSIGNQANARDGQSSVVRATALGSQTQAEDMATAVGYGAKAKKSKSVAIGNESATEGEESVAIGSSAQAHGGSVALGAHSVANDKDGAGVYTGMTSKSVVSVGNDSLYRRLVNVADGADDQDAVTVKQLKKLEVELAKTITVAKNTSASVAGAVLYDTDDGDNDTETNSVTFGGPAGSPAGSPAKLTRLQNVASGKSDTDAVNVKQLKDEIAQNSHHYFSVNDAKQTGIANYDNMGAKGERSMAIGTSAATYANNSVALGNKVTNYDEGGIAIGTEYVGSDELDDGKKTDNTTAVSKQNEGYKYGIALGAGSQTQGNNSIAIGSLAATSVQNLAEGGIDRAIALGYYAVSSGAKANAIGERARANSLQANAFGSQAQALAQSANAIGTAAMAAGANSIAIGSHQQVVGENSGSIGYAGTFTNKSIGASLSGDYGPGATRVLGSGTYSIGNMNGEIPSHESGVFGNNNLVRGSQNMRVMGNNNKIGNLAAKDAAALPVKNVYVTGHGNTIDTANNPLEDSKNIFVMGAGNTIGSTSPATKGLKITDSYVIGTGNTINESNDLLDNDEDPSDPAAAGQKAKIGKGYFILGNNVNATLQNSVYLGTSSAFIGAGTVSAGKDNYSNFNSAGFPAYQYAGGAPVGVVTIGNATETRRLQGVAAGLVAENSTDAINGSQLYAHTRPMGFVADNSGAEGKNLDGLAIDDTSITMAKRAAGQALKLNGGAKGALSDENIGTVVNGTNQVDIKLAKELKKLTSAQFGDDNANTTVNSSGVTIKDGPSFTKNSIDANNNKITKVAAGDVNANSTDAVNGSQLNEVKETAEKGWNLTTAKSGNKHNVKPGGDVDISSANANITVSNDQGNVTLTLNKDLNLTEDGSVKVGATKVTKDGVTIENGPSMTITKGINAGDKKITNVKAGEDDTDAVNYGQLKKVADSAATAGKGWTLSTGKNDTSKYVVKPEGEVNISGDDNITVTHDAGNVKVALNKKLNLGEDGSVKIDKTTLNKDGLAVGTNVKVTDEGLTAGKVSVTNNGINAGNEKITNVADGEIAANSKDAVNGGQLHNVKAELDTAVKAAKTEVEAGENVTVTTKTGNDKQTIYTVSAKDTSASVSNGSDMIKVETEAEAKKGTVHVTNYKVDLSDKAKADIQKGVDAKTAVDTKGLTFVADKNSKTEVRKLGDEVGIKGDTNITTTANGNDVNVTLNKDLKNLTSAKFGDDTANTTVNSSGVTIKDGPSMTKNGIAMNDQSITGLKSVLDGVTDVTKVEDETKLKSAVNVGDLKKVATNAFGLKDKAGNEFTQNLGTTAQITGDENVNTKVVDAKDGKKALEVSLSNNVTLGGTTKGNEDGTLAVKSANNQNSVTLNGQDGSIDIDGADAKGKVTVAQGAADVEGKTKTRIVYDVVGSEREYVATLNDGLKFGANSGDVYKAKLNNQVDIKGAATNTDWTKFDGGKNIMTQVNGSTVTVGLAKDVNVNSVTATDHVTVGGTTKITNDGVTIKDGPSMTKSNGIDASNMTIKNVAPGVNNTDAVNVGQLRTLEGKVNRVDRNLRAGVAGANAAASLPQAYLPGKNMVAVSAGTYRGEGAIALGVSRVSDNGKVVVKLTGNSDTRGNFGAGVGAGYQW